jgi:hypothetical protein
MKLGLSCAGNIIGQGCVENEVLRDGICVKGELVGGWGKLRLCSWPRITGMTISEMIKWTEHVQHKLLESGDVIRQK